MSDLAVTEAVSALSRRLRQGEITLPNVRRIQHAGVVLLRLTGLSNATKASLVAEICRDRGAELIGAFSVVEAGQIRIRQRLASP